MKKLLSAFLLLLFALSLMASAHGRKKPKPVEQVQAYDQIEPTILAHDDDFQACYKKGEKGKTGTVKIALALGADGKVTQAGIQESTLNEAVVEGCILNTLSGVVFPAPKEGTTVEGSYQFKFGSK